MLATTHDIQSQARVIKDVIAESFVENVDGFWYPIEPGTPLVRIQVAVTGYQIQRRRNERNAWMPIVTAETAEFDAGAFRSWRERWPMTAEAAPLTR